jgi:hypothetical protein
VTRSQAVALLLVISMMLVGASIGWRLGQWWPTITLALPLLVVGIGVLVWATVLTMKGTKR